MLIKLLLALIFVVACGVEPSAEQQAIHNQRVILGLRVAEVENEVTAHELVLCAVSDEYSAQYLADNCALALSTRSGKRVVFTQSPEANKQAGQRERVTVVAIPALTGGLAWFWALRRYHGLSEFHQKQMRKWLRPRAVASAFGVIALGTLAFVLLFDHHTAGGDKRAAVRYWRDMFTTDKDFKAATEVRSVEKILHATAQELELKVTPAALRMLARQS